MHATVSVRLQMLGLAVYLGTESGQDSTALLPVFDLLNHDARQEVRFTQSWLAVLTLLLDHGACQDMHFIWFQH